MSTLRTHITNILNEVFEQTVKLEDLVLYLQEFAGRDLEGATYDMFIQIIDDQQISPKEWNSPTRMGSTGKKSNGEPAKPLPAAQHNFTHHQRRIGTLNNSSCVCISFAQVYTHKPVETSKMARAISNSAMCSHRSASQSNRIQT